MLLLQYLLMSGIFVALVATYFLLKKFHKLNKWYFRSIALVIAAFFTFRYMMGRDQIQYIYKLTGGPFGDNMGLNALALISNWFFYSAVLLVAVEPFFKNKTAKNIIKLFVLPVAIFSFCVIKWQSIGVVGQSAYDAFSYRAVFLSIEVAGVLAYSFVSWFNEPFKLGKKDALRLLYIIPMLLATMPTYMISGLFGYANLSTSIKNLSYYHRLLLYIGFLLPVILYAFLHKKDYDTKKLALVYICLGTMISFTLDYKFVDITHITSLPLHLCNTAMYLMPLCLIFNMKRLFYFTLFINVLGAFLAMAVPNYDAATNILAPNLVKFFLNHYIAFFMPFLFVALGMFERPKLKQFIYSMVAFMVYFVLILFINAWFSNYGSVDYFYLNTDYIAEKLGVWAESTRKFVWTFNINELSFTFYPLYQFLYFIVYCFLGLGMWFLYAYCFSVADFYKDMFARKKQIKLDQLALEVKLAGKSKEEPMNKDGENIIALKGFSKKYASSKTYAVKDANLEIYGGEIFGFLGPNGAGKSTIIKSMVGIQPITEGAIEICGYDVNTQPVQAKRVVGFVPDHYALYEKLTGREYINYIADLYDVSIEDRTKAIDKYVKLFELEGAFDNQMKTYSHGMKQKIAIMAALVHNPRVWILDEPLTGLDPNSIFQVKECMKAHAKAGNIVFFSSHIIDVVERICDRIAIIKKGNILTCRKVSDIEKECSLEEFYLKTIGEQDLIETMANANEETKSNEANSAKQSTKPKKVKSDKKVSAKQTKSAKSAEQSAEGKITKSQKQKSKAPAKKKTGTKAKKTAEKKQTKAAK